MLLVKLGVVGALPCRISEQVGHAGAGRGLPGILAIGDGRR